MYPNVGYFYIHTSCIRTPYAYSFYNTSEVLLTNSLPYLLFFPTCLLTSRLHQTQIADAIGDFCVANDCTDLTSESRRKMSEVDENDTSVLGHMKRHLQRKLQSETLGCVLCGLYLDNLYLPPLENYEFVNVCLDDDKACDAEKKIKFVDTENPKEGEFRYANKNSPTNLQGVFSLDYSPCTWSSLVSFAETREAPGGVNTGVLGPDAAKGPIFPEFINEDEAINEFPIGPVIPRCGLTTEWDYAMRVIGDANWAYGTLT
jgi:hypothetical protein